MSSAHLARHLESSGAGLRIGSLCTGFGGLDLAVELVLGGQLAWYAETDPHASTVLARHWPDAANLGDIRAVDWSTVAPVDIVTAGFPCQDISNAGKRVGITRVHSSLWTAVGDAVRALQTPLVFVETWPRPAPGCPPPRWRTPDPRRTPLPGGPHHWSGTPVAP